MNRVFLEWADGTWLSSAHPDFQVALTEQVAQSGRPTLVEFRAAGEGYAHAQPCEDCGKSLVDCHCGEQQCVYCEEWFGADPSPRGWCPVCAANLL